MSIENFWSPSSWKTAMSGYVSGNPHQALTGASATNPPALPACPAWGQSRVWQPEWARRQRGRWQLAVGPARTARRRPGECASTCSGAVCLGENFWVRGQACIQAYQILPNSPLPCRTDLHSPQQPRGVLISLPELGIERLLCVGHFGGCVMFQICNSWITNHCQCLYVFLGNLHFFREVPVCLFFALGYLTFSSWSPRAYTLCEWQTSRLSFNSPLFFLLLSYSRLLIHGSSEC